mmetsp:Transcript_20535/g.33342  ORF Transcript_20535/g.33342 Transcript_20535/m.33342 type:complete len:131 (+) Transcript_20535:54-446(+)
MFTTPCKNRIRFVLNKKPVMDTEVTLGKQSNRKRCFQETSTDKETQSSDEETVCEERKSKISKNDNRHWRYRKDVDELCSDIYAECAKEFQCHAAYMHGKYFGPSGMLRRRVERLITMQMAEQYSECIDV